MTHLKTPPLVRAWVANLPSWVDVRHPIRRLNLDLGAGETEAISLAVELRSDVLLLDDLAARDEAHERGLKVIGMIGLLADAHSRGWLNFDEEIGRLKKMNYRISDALVERVKATL